MKTKIIFALMVTTLAGILGIGWWASETPAKSAAGIKSKLTQPASEFRRRANRVAEIRRGGSMSDGLHTLTQALTISAADYWLMGSDNSTAARNHPGVPEEQVIEQRWSKPWERMR